jgi:hypothetical protein
MIIHSMTEKDKQAFYGTFSQFKSSSVFSNSSTGRISRGFSIIFLIGESGKDFFWSPLLSLSVSSVLLRLLPKLRWPEFH